MYVWQDYVFFIPPPPHHRGRRSAFCASIDACWYGRVNLIFKMRVRTDAGPVMECQCALIETLFDYCPLEGRDWWPSTAQIGTKLLYMPSPDPVVYVVPLSHILGRLPLLPAGNYGTLRPGTAVLGVAVIRYIGGLGPLHWRTGTVTVSYRCYIDSALTGKRCDT